MSSSLYGGNLAHMDQLSRQFQTQSQQVVTLKNAIDHTIDPSQWTGPFADKFREQWNSQFKPALDHLRTSLEEAGHVVRERRGAIETATK